MSFMFNPYPYHDPAPINRPRLPASATDAMIVGMAAVAGQMAGWIGDFFRAHPAATTCRMALDGYVGADWTAILDQVESAIAADSLVMTRLDMAAAWRPAAALEAELRTLLPHDPERDPVSLFGRLHQGELEDLFDASAVANFANRLTSGAASGRGDGGRQVVVVCGVGAAHRLLAGHYDAIYYCDVTPYQVALRTRAGQVRCLGDRQAARPLRETFRRLYYVDFELAIGHRRRLLAGKLVDFYVDGNDPECPKLIPRDALEEVFTALTRMPFRCTPCYLEGVWGGHFVRRIRQLPAAMKNCAWVFDLIPSEVSVQVQVGAATLEFPFSTFYRHAGHALLGEECLRRFGGGFPVRFNYDDTWHAAGNMSIQVHPAQGHAREHFAEPFAQDESYYVVAAGHDAATYLGLREQGRAEEFLAEVRRSEETGQPCDYRRHVHALASRIGDQFLIPAGTVHASGRNQLVLEIGSLTVGSYTFKLYDYVRQDLDGKPRPIHSWHGGQALRRERDAAWVTAQLRPEPRVLRQGDGWRELRLGEHELLYFSLRRLDFERQMEDDTAGRFHVLALVDGESVRIVPEDRPEDAFIQRFLEIVVVPAALGRYRLENLGDQPVKMHKTMVRPEDVPANAVVATS